MGGPRAAADALIRKGKEHEREMDVRAAVKCYEVNCLLVTFSLPHQLYECLQVAWH